MVDVDDKPPSLCLQHDRCLSVCYLQKVLWKLFTYSYNLKVLGVNSRRNLSFVVFCMVFVCLHCSCLLFLFGLRRRRDSQSLIGDRRAKNNDEKDE